MATQTPSALKPGQLDELRRQIHERMALLDREIREDAQRLRQENADSLSNPAADTGDASIADLIADLHSAELDRDVQELRELSASLARIEDGTFGECMDCGQDIGFPRLNAQPIARRCLECQQRFEATHGTPGAPTL
jgi:RNA polymerase-binding protein DksA